MRKFALLLVAFAGLVPFADPQAPKVPDPPKLFDPAAFGRGYVPPTPQKRAALYAGAKARHGNRLAMQAAFQALPAAFDCREKGWTVPVGDQGQCGSCYLVSTVLNMSDAFVKVGYGKPDGSFLFAAQYGMDCHGFGGCGGGNGTEVIDWALKNGWPAENWVDALNGAVFHDYPGYSARSLSCRKVPTAKYWKPMDWGFATGDQSNRPATVNEIKTAMYNYGTLNVALDAGGQFGNGTGTITSLGRSIDHEIGIAAWNDNNDNGDGTKGALLLKNQWGRGWGQSGYRWVAYHAVPALVDIFWISAAPLPPAPPQPGVPVITSATTATGVVGKPFSYTITATNAPDFFGAMSLPLGLALDSVGAISGTPQVAGTSQIGLSARNTTGTGTATLTLTVAASPEPPPISGLMVILPQDTKAGTYTLVRPEDLDEIQRRLDVIRGGGK